MTVELKPCPLCGEQPRRNGRLGAGGVLCLGPSRDHRVQVYGSNQYAADLAWNMRSAPVGSSEDLRAALAMAKSHIEHMAAWIVSRSAGYSFESLGEDMPAIYAALAAKAPNVEEEYVTVSLSRDGIVTTHNAFDADFDEMVRATETIVKSLTQRLSDRKFCPYSHGAALKTGALSPSVTPHLLSVVDEG